MLNDITYCLCDTTPYRRRDKSAIFTEDEKNLATLPKTDPANMPNTNTGMPFLYRQIGIPKHMTGACYRFNSNGLHHGEMPERQPVSTSSRGCRHSLNNLTREVQSLKGCIRSSIIRLVIGGSVQPK